MLIELRGTEFNRRTNLFRGLGRFNRGLALIGFRTTGARWLIVHESVKRKRSTITCSSFTKLAVNMTISLALFPAVTVTVVRDRKIRTALRTNQIAGLVTVPSWKKNKLAYLSGHLLFREASRASMNRWCRMTNICAYFRARWRPLCLLSFS